MKLIRILSAVILVTLMLSAPFAYAAPPATLSYQGTLNNADGTPVNVLKKLTFKLYKAATGIDHFWTETQDNVYVTNGRFATVFGASTAPANPLNPSDFSADVYLGITLGTATDPEMTPRQKMTSVPFAFNATNAINATNGVPAKGIIMWSGAIIDIPSGWALCDGKNGTPNLLDKFIIGAGSGVVTDTPPSSYAVNAAGGNKEHFHKGAAEKAGDVGDLRAVVGVINSDARTMGYKAVPAFSPNTNEGISANGYSVGQGGTTGITASFNAFTPVVGYTSNGYMGIPAYGANGAASAGSLPPYYALAYIMKL